MIINVEWIVAVASVLSGAGAAASAAIAWSAVRSSIDTQAKSEKQSHWLLWIEINSSASKSDALFKCIDRISTNLQQAYETLATFSGQSSKQGRPKIYIDRVETEREEARKRNENCARVAASFYDLTSIDHESACDSKARLEANVIQLSHTLEILRDELFRIERQNDQHRAQRLRPSIPSQAVAPRGTSNKR